jgi:HEAT repeat protein
MSLTNQNLTEQAQIAAKQNNWSFVNQCLHELLQSEKDAGKDARKKPAIASNQIKKHEIKLNSSNPNQPFPTMLDLALEVLEFGDFQARWEVAKIFPNLGNAAIAPLMDILQDEEAEIELRWFAGQILGQFDRPEVIEVLIDLVNSDSDEELCLVAAEALANIGLNAIQGLETLLKNDSSRLFAVRALAKMHRLEIIEPLLTVVDDSDPLIRKAAITALSNFDHARIPPILVTALSDLMATVRLEAVIGLGLFSMRSSADMLPEMLPENLVDLLRDRLWDFNLEVCQQAAIALMRVGNESAANALFAVVKSPNTPIPLAVTVVNCLGWISHPTALDYLEQALTLPLSSAVIEAIISSLGRVEVAAFKPKAAHILINFLKSETSNPAIKQPKIKQAIAVGLGQLAEAIAIEPLKELLADDNETVRLHAIAALKHFDSKAIGENLQGLLSNDALTQEINSRFAIDIEKLSSH